MSLETVAEGLTVVDSPLSVQLRLQLWEAYCEVRCLCSHLRGNDVTDSALSTDSSMDESSETSSAKDVPTGSLHTSLLELRRLTQNLLDGNESTVRNYRFRGGVNICRYLNTLLRLFCLRWWCLLPA